MVTPRTSQQGMVLSDPDTMRRLDATNIPPALAATLSAIDVSVSLVERTRAAGIDWILVGGLCQSGAINGPDDLSALHTLLNMGLRQSEVQDWATMGSLDAALRLYLKNVPIEVVRRFPLTGEHGLVSFLRMVRSTQNTGIHLDDLWWWHAAGVVSLDPPYLIEELWAPWRSVAVLRLGMRAAALSAAAGLRTDEAIELWETGQVTQETLLMMAGLRSGTA